LGKTRGLEAEAPYKGRGGGLGVRAQGQQRRMRCEPELGSGSGSVRPKVGDDRWPPPVGDRGRREAEKGLLGRLGGLGGVKRRAELKRSRSGRGL
jgi:hypothetical protein